MAQNAFFTPSEKRHGARKTNLVKSTAKSEIVEHALTTGHQINFDETRILAHGSYFWDSILLEAIELNGGQPVEEEVNLQSQLYGALWLYGAGAYFECKVYGIFLLGFL